MKMEGEGAIWALIIICGIMGIGGIIGYAIAQDDVAELAQSICEQEYDMDFDKYEDGKLYCKPALVTESYDGIKIIIAGGE